MYTIQTVISKHLMLLFIVEEAKEIIERAIFQNISCYCLSKKKQKKLRMNGNFKTSHVIVYLQPPDQQHSFHHHFKTSHVIVYPEPSRFDFAVFAFQNISCYCLSVTIPFIVFADTHFKTSHVIVYQGIHFTI